MQKANKDKRKANQSGPQIRRVREDRGMDQVELAIVLESDFDLALTQSDISEIERQIRGVRDYELDAIGRALEVDVRQLLRESKSQR